MPIEVDSHFQSHLFGCIGSGNCHIWRSVDPTPGPAGKADFPRHWDTLPRSDLTHSVLQASSSAGCGSEMRPSLFCLPNHLSQPHSSTLWTLEASVESMSPGIQGWQGHWHGCTALLPLGIHTPQINIQQSPDSEKCFRCGTGAMWGWGQPGTRDVARKLAPGEGKGCLTGEF